ncbi:MAG: 30S ribosome-binding factor RbfA [Acidobacteriota bacterium]
MPLPHRVERVAEQIREEVSQILSTEVADPGIGLVTVTRVKVTADLSLARVYWTALGDAAQRQATTKALARCAAYVRHLLSTRMTLRRSPEVQFLFDRAVAAQDRVEQILQELRQQGEAQGSTTPPDAPTASAPAAAAPDAARTADTPDAPDASKPS